MIAEALMCMALNIYHEAKNQSMLGQIAVGQVVMNRVEDRRFPNTVCEVVKQAVTYKGTDVPVLHKCHFSWYCDGKDDIPDDETGWATAQYVAGSILYANKHRGITEGATHYHASYVRPKWTRDRGMNHIGRIGAHIFYRWD